MLRPLRPTRVELSRQVRGIKSSLLLSGINVGRDVVLSPFELGDHPKQIYRTLVIPSDVDTYYYARPLTHQPIFRTTQCRICDLRVKVYQTRWVFAKETGESIPICDNCMTKDD
jgi:hypothetical protein